MVGGAPYLVGRSHECDFPTGAVQGVPMLTAQRYVQTRFYLPVPRQVKPKYLLLRAGIY
jgi:hypothetical protein